MRLTVVGMKYLRLNRGRLETDIFPGQIGERLSPFSPDFAKDWIGGVEPIQNETPVPPSGIMKTREIFI